ncbi:MAG: zinc-ribbon domain-containing protein, partial [Candidatus Jordarchaeaceae archaeon]
FYAALLFMVVGLTDFIGGTLRVLTSRESTTIVSVAMATLVFFTGVPNPLLFNLMYGAVSLKLLLPIISAKTIFSFLFLFLFYDAPHLLPLLEYETVGIFLPLNEFYNLNILSAMVTASIVPVTVRLQIWGERQRKTNFIVGLLKSRDHIKIDEIASRLGISSAETEALLIDLMARNKIRGKITKEGEFISAPTAVPYKVTKVGGEMQPVVKEVVKEKEVKEREIVFIRCRHCGTKVLESESKCPNCGAAL